MLKWSEWRSRELGLKYLEWEMNLMDDDKVHLTSQAKAAQEQYELYTWWKDIRPNRPDPYEVAGYNAYWETHERDKSEDGLSWWCSDVNNNTEIRDMFKVADKVEMDYEREDS